MASNVIPIGSVAPRAPIIYNEKSGTLDRPDKYYDQARAWREAARAQAIEDLKLNPERDYITTYIQMIMGQYWGKRRARYRSRFFDNRIAEARLNHLCAMTDTRPSVEVSTTSTIPAFVSQAEILSKMITSVWDTHDLDLATEAVVDHANLSVGYWKIGATMATESMPAQMIVLPCGMDQVLPIQRGWNLQDSSAVLYRVFKPLHRVKQAYGKAADGLERYVSASSLSFVGGHYPDGNIPEYSFNAQNPMLRQQPFGRAAMAMARECGPFASVEVEEYWIDDPTVNESLGEIQVKDPRLPLEAHNYHYRVPRGERLFPRKRLMVWVGNILLYDGPAPYWHGLYPFSELVLRPTVWSPGGLSAYRNLVPHQVAINKVGAGVLDLVERCADPQMVFADGAVDDTSFRGFSPDLHGAKLKMAPTAIWGQHVGYVSPPPLPSYVDRFVERVDRSFDRQSGVMDVAAMMGKRQVPGGDTVEQFRDSSQSVYRLDARHIEPFMRASGTQFVSNFFQFWTREQRMWMLGADGITWEDFDFDPGTMIPWSAPKENHWRRFPVRITPGSTHGAKRDRDKQVAISLFRMGGISRREMLRKLGYGESQIAQIEEEIAQEHGGSIEPDAIGKGAVPRLTRGQRVGNPYIIAAAALGVSWLLQFADLAARILT